MEPNNLSSQHLHESVARTWGSDIVPELSGLIEIPALSPAFDPNWQSTGFLDAAVEHVRRWLADRDLPGARVEIVRLPGRTPLLLADIPAHGATSEASDQGPSDHGAVLLYGHLDKQPPVGGWSEGLAPWRAVLRDGRLYGRGAADDGYSGYAATAAIEAVRAAGGAHARCVVLLETGEESGSPDLPAYLDHLAGRLGTVSLVICLDSGGKDYKRLWLTTSLRGVVSVDVTVRVLDSAQHSGMASGIVPSSMRILRVLLDRLEDPATGRVLLPEMHADVPEERLAEIKAAAEEAPGLVRGAFPLAPGVRPVGTDEVELSLNGTWRPTLSIIGADGLPRSSEAGNVLRTHTTLSLSFRLPPTADASAAFEALHKALTTDVPYDAQVEISRSDLADGWNAPSTAPWLRAALDDVSDRVFGAPWGTMGLGGSIPFMALLAERYPRAQFVITGALGPDSNAHVPDEWLHLDQAARLSEAVAHILHAHAVR